MSWRALLTLVLALVCVASLSGCPENPIEAPLRGQVKLTLIHTADIHSRLFPYALQVNQSDATLGLGAADSIVTVGGVARVSYVVNRERAKADRVLHLDGGDCFQGAPIFNFYNGEVEVRAMSTMGTDAQVIANHEFDKGALNVRTQMQKWANYPVLAANYLIDDANNVGDPGMSNVLQPFTTFNLRGLKVGVIGMGNLSTISSLFERPNRLGITPLETIDVAQAYIDLLRPLVDVIVVITHLGLGADQQMIQNTTGIDVVLGGHNHIVLQPPQVLNDCSLSDANGNHFIWIKDADGNPKPRRCTPRRVVLAHSGAFSKYVGRLDLLFSNDLADLDFPAGSRGATGALCSDDPKDCYDPLNGFELVSHQYSLFPITDDLPMDRAMVEMLEPYRNQLDTLLDLDLLVGYAPNSAKRFGSGGGDSPLGNLIASAMWRRQGIETDFSMTNSTGIRADLVPGPVTVEEVYNIFPFDNSITKMDLSGTEVQDMFDFVARKSATRGCASQVQIAGARVVFNCAGCNRPPPACSTDNDCVSNQCLNKQCVVTACAEHIYIGATEHPCSTDADCGGQPNACDIARLDKNGQGRCLTQIDPKGSYELATSNYLAAGGSGFVVLKKNTTQLDTKVQQRDAMIDWVRGAHPCGWDPNAGTPEGLKACNLDSDCGADQACACPGNAAEDAQGTCHSYEPSNNGPGCPGASGRCVLAACRQDVSNYYRKICQDQQSAKAIVSCAAKIPPCRLGGEQCKYLGCVDRAIGSFADGRVQMVGQ